MNTILQKDNDRMKLFKKYGYDITRARKFIISKAKIAEGESILEIGTGRGHMTTALAQKGFELTTVDIDKKAQGVAKIHIKAANCKGSVIFKVMDAEKLRYRDGSFDNVITVNFMHHAKNPIQCLREMVRVAKNKLIISDLNRNGERIMEKVHKLDGNSHPLSNISFEEMEALLKNDGIKVSVYKDICQTVLIAKKGELQ